MACTAAVLIWVKVRVAVHSQNDGGKKRARERENKKGGDEISASNTEPSRG